MKKIIFLLAALIVAAAAYASTTITVSPSTMKDGETKTLTDDGATIKVTRNGDSVDVKVEGAGKSRTITVTNGGEGDITINRNGHRFRVVTPDVVVPPVRVPRFREHSGGGALFVCPKDHAMLRVPEEKKDESFKCPVDGTTMEKRKGRAFLFSFDDADFDFDSFDWL